MFTKIIFISKYEILILRFISVNYISLLCKFHIIWIKLRIFIACLYQLLRFIYDLKDWAWIHYHVGYLNLNVSYKCLFVGHIRICINVNVPKGLETEIRKHFIENDDFEFVIRCLWIGFSPLVIQTWVQLWALRWFWNKNQ